MTIKSKKILILTTSYLPLVGGSEIAIKEVTDRLTDFQFDLVTARFSGKIPIFEKLGRVRVFRVGYAWQLLNFLLPKNFLPLAIFKKALALARHEGPYDLIHVFQASQAGGAAWLLKFFYPKLPLLLTLQEGQNLERQNALTKLFRRLIIQKASQATAISTYLKNYLVKIRKNLSVTLIPNGVDIAKFSQNFSYGELSRLNDSLKIRPGEKVVISVSRLSAKNGLDDLIKAFSALVSKKPGVQYKLLLVGEGSFKKELERIAEELSLSDKIVFAGTVGHDELPKYLKLAHVFVRPSRSEGLGNAFLEAMAAGVPVIGPAIGGIPDFLTDRQTGLFCRYDDPQDIAQKIEMVFDDENLRRKIISQASDLIKEKYHWDQIAQEYRGIYAQLI